MDAPQLFDVAIWLIKPYLYRLLLDLVHCWVLFKESLNPVASNSRWFGAVRRMELEDTLRAIMDLVKQRADSKAVHSIDIG